MKDSVVYCIQAFCNSGNGVYSYSVREYESAGVGLFRFNGTGDYVPVIVSGMDRFVNSERWE